MLKKAFLLDDVAPTDQESIYLQTASIVDVVVLNK